MPRKKKEELPALPPPEENKQDKAVSQQQTISVASKQLSKDVVDPNQPRYQTPADYAMKGIHPSYLLEKAEPISIESPKKWADLVEEEENQLAQTSSDSWSDTEFLNWCKLMGIKATISDPKIRKQFIVFKNLCSTVAASGHASSSSSVAAKSTTQTPVVAKSPNTQSTSTVYSAPKQALSSPVPQPISSFKSSSPEEPTYFKNDNVYPLTQIEPEFWHPNPQEVASQMLSPSANFIQQTPDHTQKFYEFILADTKSCLFKPYKDKQTQGYVTHTTVWINKIISPKEWGTLPTKYKKFSQPFRPQYFNYYDYKAAWMNAFTFQNHLGKHSWFILWGKQLVSEFPQWFIHQWWPVYGHKIEILPPLVKEGYEYFNTRFFSQQQIPVLLQFSHRFHLPWIYSQKFAFHKPEGHKGLPWLALQGHTKWYKNWNPSEAYVPALEKWFLENPKYLSPTDAAQYSFFQQKSIAAAQLASSSNKGDFIEQMELILQQLKAGSSSQKSQPSSEEEEEDEEEDPDYDLAEE